MGEPSIIRELFILCVICARRLSTASLIKVLQLNAKERILVSQYKRRQLNNE